MEMRDDPPPTRGKKGTAMKKMNLIRLAAMVLSALLLCGTTAFAAEGGKYYMIEGTVYAHGDQADIDRIEIVDGVSSVVYGGRNEYALCGYDLEYNLIGIVNLDVRFEGISDGGGEPAEYAAFVALMPYDERIVALAVVDASDMLLGYASVTPKQLLISFFDVEETDSGFELQWNTEVYDDKYANDVDYDVMAVSQISGEKIMLAYRIKENSLTIPYEWLDPNDTIVFMLVSNDSGSTITETSGEYDTPDGESKFIEDMDLSSSDYEDDEDDELLTNIIFTVLTVLEILLAVGVIVVIVLFIKKKSKKKKK